MKSVNSEARARFRLCLLIALSGLLLLPGAALGATSVCTSAEIEEPFRLPAGPLHDPARLSLCDGGDYSPSSSFHEVRVDGETVARLISRREANETGGPEAPFLMFLRGADGHLTLLGYAYPVRDGMQTYAFGPAADRNAVLAAPFVASDEVVLLAARFDRGGRAARGTTQAPAGG
jgi:hypothetical protein